MKNKYELVLDKAKIAEYICPIVNHSSIDEHMVQCMVTIVELEKLGLVLISNTDSYTHYTMENEEQLTFFLLEYGEFVKYCIKI